MLSRNAVKDFDFTQFSSYVIKPISEGSSRGVMIVEDGDEVSIDGYKWEFGDKVIVQEFIKGRELAVAVLKGKAIGILELKPLHRKFYDYDSKYLPNMTEHTMPASLPEDVQQHLF